MTDSRYALPDHDFIPNDAMSYECRRCGIDPRDDDGRGCPFHDSHIPKVRQRAPGAITKVFRLLRRTK